VYSGAQQRVLEVEAITDVADVELAAAESDLELRFATFVEQHRERARRMAWRLVGGDAGAADDVTQEAFVRAWMGLGRFRGEATLGTWFYRILVRQAAHYRRWRQVRELWGGIGTPDAPDPKPDANSDPALRARIGAVLERLPRGQREAFVLVHVEEFTVNESAEILGKAPGTVKSHLHRALRALGTELADLAGGEGAE
jgi:RNA polymerase sigma-70 factor (ECF subfamily)